MRHGLHHPLLLALALTIIGLAMIVTIPNPSGALGGVAVFWSGVGMWFTTRYAAWRH